MRRKALLLILSLALVMNFLPFGIAGAKIEKNDAYAVVAAPAAPYIFFTIASLMGFGIYATSQTDFDAQISSTWASFNDFVEEVYNIGPTSQIELMQSCIDPNTGQLVMGLLGSSAIPRLVSAFFDYMGYDIAADTGAFGSTSNVSGVITIGNFSLNSYIDFYLQAGFTQSGFNVLQSKVTNQTFYSAWNVKSNANANPSYNACGAFQGLYLSNTEAAKIGQFGYYRTDSDSGMTSYVGTALYPLYGGSNVQLGNTTYYQVSPLYVDWSKPTNLNVYVDNTLVGVLHLGTFTPNSAGVSAGYVSSGIVNSVSGSGSGLLTDNPDVIGGLDESILPGNVDVYDGGGLEGAYDYQDILDYFGTALVPGLDVWNLGQETLESIRLGLQSWTGTAQGLLSSILEGLLSIPQSILSGIGVIMTPLTTLIEGIFDAVQGIASGVSGGDLTEVPAVSTSGIESGLIEIEEAIGDKFPFCVVYDLNLIIGSLVAQPVTPVFVYPIETPVGDYFIDIDLSDFDGVADLTRKGFVLVAICGLIMLSVRLWDVYQAGRD